MAEGSVDQHDPQGDEEEVGGEAEAVGEGAGHERGGDASWTYEGRGRRRRGRGEGLQGEVLSEVLNEVLEGFEWGVQGGMG